MQSRALWALGVLAASAESQSRAARTGAASCLSPFPANSPLTFDVRSEAPALTHTRTHLHPQAAAGALPAVVAALRAFPKDVPVCQHALWCLANLAFLPENQAEAAEEGAIEEAREHTPLDCVD